MTANAKDAQTANEFVSEVNRNIEASNKEMEHPNLPKLLYIGFKLIPQIPYKIGV